MRAVTRFCDPSSRSPGIGGSTRSCGSLEGLRGGGASQREKCQDSDCAELTPADCCEQDTSLSSARPHPPHLGAGDTDATAQWSCKDQTGGCLGDSGESPLGTRDTYLASSCRWTGVWGPHLHSFAALSDRLCRNHQAGGEPLTHVIDFSINWTDLWGWVSGGEDTPVEDVT